MPFLSIANGALWLQRSATDVIQLESPFARELIRRDADSRRTSSWKHAERETPGSGMLSGPALWGRGGGNGEGMAPARFLYACGTGDAQVFYYLLAVGQSIGLFRFHADEQREVRLFHRQKSPVLGMTYAPQSRHLIVANGQPDGTAQLDVYDEDGNHKGAVTGGDSLDAAPSMVPGAVSTLVYQSCGVARHAQSGGVVALGHSAIHRLDYRTGQLDTLLEDADFDFVAPRIGSDGTLYAIRRPVDKPVREHAGLALKDTLLIPFRLAKAVFGYLNFFSMIYGKEPLRSAGGPRAPELDQDLGKLWLHGRMIELSKVRTDAQYAGNLVPASWELVAQRPGRGLEVLANHVASFDLAPDGSLLYTNGYDILSLAAGQKASRLGRQELVEGVAAL